MLKLIEMIIIIIYDKFQINIYIYDIINNAIESKRNISSLSSYIRDEDDILNRLRTYIEYFSSDENAIPIQN